MSKPLIILYTHKIPYPYHTGTNQRIKSLVAFLRKSYKVGLIVPVYHPTITSLEESYDFVWFGGRYNTFLDKLRWHATGWLKMLLLRIQTEVSRRDFANPLIQKNIHAAWKLNQVCRSHLPALVIVEKIFSTVPAVTIAKHHKIPVWLDVHDLYTISEAGITDAVRDRFSGITTDDEVRLLRQYDTLIAIQHNDAGLLRKLLPGKNIILAMHPVGTHSGNHTEKLPFRLLFVGSSAQHNVEAIRVFVDEVLPKVALVCPETELEVCGSVVSSLEANVPNVRLTGVADDLAVHYAQANIVINPALSGSGLKIKTVEALAYGKCLVTTPIGAEGLANAEQAMAVVEPDRMHETIIRLLYNTEQIKQYEHSAKAYAASHFTPDVCYAELMAELGFVIEEKSKS
jgi:glycosyltransferase involved in cell wall biosynthesis